MRLPTGGRTKSGSILHVKAYFARYERHVVFFRELSDKRIGMLTILHAAMDLPVRLDEDLARLERLGD